MTETHTPRPIVGLTPKAIEKVFATMQSEGRSGHGLRLSVVKGGCSGYEYSIKFAEQPNEGDIAYEIDKLRVFVDPGSVEKLEGTVLDYVDGMYGAGLKFTNPNAVHSCGCGSSFSTENDETAN